MTASPGHRPNVLLIVTDHTNAAAVAPGSPCLKPNLDRLAAEGVRFHRCHTPNAICSPSRASLMTGLFPSTHGIWDCTHTQRKGWVDLAPGEFPFFPERLRNAGYRTGYFGKWHVESSGRLDRFGWSEYDLGCSHLPTAREGDPSVVLRTPGYPDHALCGVLADEPGGPPPSHPAFDHGIAFIRRHAAGGAPFCCAISTTEPHDPYLAFRRYLDRYDLDRIPLPPTLRNPAADKPELVRRMQRVWRDLSDADWRLLRASYWAVLSHLDHEVGRALDALRAAGVYEETAIVFTSDHGDMLGAQGLGTKGGGTPYEPVYNIPLIVRLPGGAGGGREDRVTQANTTDLAPTLLDLCGVAPIEGAQGRSLRPALEGAAMDPGDNYAEFYGQRFVYTQRIVWHGDWKYVFSPGGVDELYDLAADPHEARNLADDPAHRAVLLDMVRRMWRRARALGDASLLNSGYPTLRTAPVGPRE